ncbi:MAG: RidA family protein [Hyphomicrobiales bacterium]|nr:RidA family protein [Hyphomicrobiales bacterium]
MPDPVQSTPSAQSPESRLKALGLTLPRPAAPVANYLPFVLTGNQLVISGQLPFDADGKLPPEHTGKLGHDIFNEAGQAAARQCAINILAQAREALGSLNRVQRCVRLGGFVNVAPDYATIPAIVNGASDLMVAVFGEKGKHARAAVGVANLPLDAAVEVEALFQVET